MMLVQILHIMIETCFLFHSAPLHAPRLLPQRSLPSALPWVRRVLPAPLSVRQPAVQRAVAVRVRRAAARVR